MAFWDQTWLHRPTAQRAAGVHIAADASEGSEPAAEPDMPDVPFDTTADAAVTPLPSPDHHNDDSALAVQLCMHPQGWKPSFCATGTLAAV